MYDLNEIRAEYKSLALFKRSVRAQVKKEFAEQIEAEIERRTVERETVLSKKVVEARKNGVKRQELALALSASTSERFDRFMELGGWYDEVEEVEF